MYLSYKRLFKKLIDMDISKKQLAAISDVSVATITKLGNDGTVVNIDILLKICSALGCTLNDICEIVV